ncbi:hypothetical protein TWF694_006041 [Orbilia ellipsospora]|uniref:Ankyrin repeat protein n=1 Tax=Orbilia ellipsospora TaxID=2528407 RepID=A0AAV9WR52_9PEZI
MATLPPIPTEPSAFLSYIGQNEDKPLRELVKPYLEYESNLRRIFAQEPENEAIADNLVGLVPLYDGHDDKIKIQSRNVEAESEEAQGCYIMGLEKERKKTGERAVVDQETFLRNFDAFTEGSLKDLNWNHIVAAGSSVMTPLLPVPEKSAESDSALRRYYHSTFAPTSDIDLFIYGTKDESVAIKRIEAVEKTITKNLSNAGKNEKKKPVLSIRTKNTITIVSEYPHRHIQIVLRLYTSVSEILTGFDVSCACAAFNGKQVYANPRAIVSWMLQCNDVDLSRRSPSYEFRLAKYRKRGFEIYYPDLNRKVVDPTIYERNLRGLKGLAKLLVMERLPSENEREEYLNMRRRERNRPDRRKPKREKKVLRGDIKGKDPEIPDWGLATTDDESMYETISIPYGPRFNAERIKKLLFQADMFLNSEWNTRIQKRRGAYLHRHPAFFGTVKYIVKDCCGYCPDPDPHNEEEKAMRVKDDKYYIRGPISFIKDDPGRQEIGSFNPITDEDWTEMAYLSINEVLCRAIVANDAEAVKAWIAEGNDVNKRDYTGRTPLHLATLSSTPEVVKVLLDAGARITARLFDGRTALHIAAARGNVDVAKLLLMKSEQNEKEKEERGERAQKKAAETTDAANPSDDTTAGPSNTAADADVEMKDAENEKGDEEAKSDDDGDDDISIISSGAGSVSAKTGVSSYVDVRMRNASEDPELGATEEEEVVEDDILDVNITDWDYQLSALHYAIIHNHPDLVTLLVSDFGADVLKPVVISYTSQGVPASVILSTALIFRIPDVKSRAPMLRTLLKLGASSAQTDMDGITALMRVVQYDDLECLKVMFEEDSASAISALEYVNIEWKEKATNALVEAITNDNEEMALYLLEKGVLAEITPESFVKVSKGTDYQRDRFIYYTIQPAELALEMEMPEVFKKCIENGVDPSSYSAKSRIPDTLQVGWISDYQRRYKLLLDLVNDKIESWEKDLNDLKFPKPPKTPKKKKEPKLKKLVSIPEQYEEGSYEYWMAKKLIRAENKIRKRHNEIQIGEEPKPYVDNKDPEKVKIKIEKIETLVQRYKELAELLISKEAKTFKDLHPQLWEKVFGKKPEPVQTIPAYQKPEEEEKEEEDKFEIKFEFEIERYKKLDTKTSAAYQELFKAVWAGNEELVRKYTTTNWEEDMPPLLAGVKNQLDYTLLSVAVYREHPKEFLDVLLTISQSQYLRDHKPKEKTEKIYRLGGDYDFQMEEIDYTEVKLTGLVGDEEKVEERVRAKASAVDLLNMTVPRVLTNKKKDHSNEKLLVQAIHAGNSDLVLYLTSRIEAFDGPKVSPGMYEPSLTPHNLINSLVREEQIEILQDFIEKYGLGSVFDGKNNFKYEDSDDEEEESENEGEKMEEDKPKEEKKPYKRPKAYLGLSINGKKQKEWTNLMNPNYAGPPRLTFQNPPLGLFAAFHGSTKLYEWLESDSSVETMRRWQSKIEKSEGAKKSYFLKVLQAADDETVQSWFGVDHPLLIHAIIKNEGPRRDEETTEEEKFAWYEKNIKFFTEKNPENLEYRKNAKGFTPLILAASTLNKYAMKALLDLGADAYAKIPDGNFNIIHMMVKSFIRNYSFYSYSLGKQVDPPKWTDLRDCLNLLPDDVKKWAFAHRASENHILYTPLAYTLTSLQNTIKSVVVKLLLEHSYGADTRLRTSLGDMPVHTMAKTPTVEALQSIIDASPLEVPMAENTNGMTALELATLAWYNKDVLKSEKSLTYAWQSWSYGNAASRMSITKDVEEEKKEEEEEKLDTSLRAEEWGIEEDDSDRIEVMKILNVALGRCVEGGAGMRTLVPLKDVNETAERLANRKKRKNFWWSEGGRYDDIVNTW